MKKICKTLIAFTLTLAGMTAVHAQTNGSNSSYSRFGTGLLSDQSQGRNRSMGGVSQGLRSTHNVNKLNPASYSAVDSLTFIFDAGMSLQRTKMKLGDSRNTANNTNFEYINTMFRVRKNLGMSLGFQPFTAVGYSFSQEQAVGTDPYTGQNITNSFALDGNGGLHEVYAGLGWRPIKFLSVGANAGLMWGNIEHTVIQTFAENGTANSSSYSSLRTYYNSTLRTWRGDIGLQAEVPLSKADHLVVGATVGIGHKIGGESTLLRTVLSGDTIKKTVNKAFELPMSYSFGASWNHKDQLVVAADATLEQWKNCTTPQFDNNALTYSPKAGEYRNRLKLNAGVEYTPAIYDHNYLKRICYRAGAYYASSYQNISLASGGQYDGPVQFGLTAGLGLPIANGITHTTLLNIYTPSYVNIGIEWARRKPSSEHLIAENLLRLNIGITFNELWFQKWKFK